MFLSESELFELKDIGLQAARDAGTEIMHWRNTDPEIDMKTSGHSRASRILTRADIASQRIILGQLDSCVQKYDLGLLSEEQPDNNSRLHKDYFWAIDPMDGTLAFTEADHGFTVSISLLERSGKPLLGIIHDPVSHDSWWAVAGHGAWMEQYDSRTMLQPGSSWDEQTLRIHLDQGSQPEHLHPELRAAITALADSLGYTAFEFVTGGGAVWNALQCFIDGGCYFKLPKAQQGGGCNWDYAATACLAGELDAWCSDAYGNPLMLNQPGSCFMNHCGVMYAGSVELGKALKHYLGLK